MTNPLNQIVVGALEDIKAIDIVVLDVTAMTDVMDTLVVASGNSNRQVKALADNVVEECKKAGYQPLGVEGGETAEWVLVDLGDVVVHVMLPETRKFYELEKLWSVRPDDLKNKKP
ncbi:MAG: ribosome silencing factor [Porticoccaceae bacterium]|nr:ribosome silencing factor [Pseudomonadota bacterium]HLS98646.1 ribosome silencing factor [Porticoccaceae bacterium]